MQTKVITAKGVLGKWVHVSARIEAFYFVFWSDANRLPFRKYLRYEQLKIPNPLISLCLRSFQEQALVKEDNRHRGSAVTIINPVPFDGCP